MNEYILPMAGNTSVYIDGKVLEGVRGYAVSEKTRFYTVRELLGGAVENMPLEITYTIKLKMGLENKIHVNSNFTLTVKTPEYVRAYSGARVLAVDEIMNSEGRYEYVYTVEALRKSEAKSEE